MPRYSKNGWVALILGVLTSAMAQQGLDVITLERTPCFGTCPVYSLRIDSSGNVSYEGKQWVATQGARTSSITADQFRELVAGFARIGFAELKGEYRVGPGGVVVSDQPTTLIALTQNGETKTISDYAYAPPELQELERTIERTANVHRWLHDETARLTLSSPDSGPGLNGIEDLKNERAIWADVFARIKPGMTPLMQAAGSGDTTGIRRALADGEDVNAADETGWTALMIAAVAVKPEAVAMLLEAGARADQGDRGGNTALIGAAAVRFGDLQMTAEVLGKLLANGAAVEQTNDRGESALMWASKSGNPEAIDRLLKAGANPRRTDQAGQNALSYLRKARNNLTFDKTLVDRYDRAARVLEQSLKPTQQ